MRVAKFCFPHAVVTIYVSLDAKYQVLKILSGFIASSLIEAMLRN